jgi:hypothetical protein
VLASSRDRLWRVETARFCGGFVSIGGKVVDAAPFLRKVGIVGLEVTRAFFRIADQYPGCVILEVKDLSSVSEFRLKVTRRINLGNYEHVEIEASTLVSKDDDSDTPQKLRERAVDEVMDLLADAKEQAVPKRRQRYDEG